MPHLPATVGTGLRPIHPLPALPLCQRGIGGPGASADQESRYGENYSWCIKAREHGVRCVVDTSVILGHAKGIIIGEGDCRKRAKVKEAA